MKLAWPWIPRLAAWLQRAHGAALDSVDPEEIGAAVRLLYGTRNARRKRQRKRRHLSYKQRDGIAWLLIRLQHERKGNAKMSRTRADWISEFTQQMSGLSDHNAHDIADAAEQKADDQQARTGTDDAAMWQNPGASAQATLNEWNAETQEAGEQRNNGEQRAAGRPGQDDNDRPNQDLPNEPGRDRPGENRPRPDQGLPEPGEGNDPARPDQGLPERDNPAQPDQGLPGHRQGYRPDHTKEQQASER
jgi:hypothetical protein